MFYLKAIVLRVKTSVLRVKHWINDPLGHKLQITLINGFTRKTDGFTRKSIAFTRKTLDFTRKTFHFTRKTVGFTRKTMY